MNMNCQIIIKKMNSLLFQATTCLASWLSEQFSSFSGDWWTECVLEKLSFNQRTIAYEKNCSKISDFDLAALLRIADKNWYALNENAFFPPKYRNCIRDMMSVRNNWAHCSSELPSRQTLINDSIIVASFLEAFSTDQKLIDSAYTFRDQVVSENYDAAQDIRQEELDENVVSNTGDIAVNSIVYPVGKPDIRGVVMSIEQIGGTHKYTVFISNALNTYYEGQILPVIDNTKTTWIDIPTLHSFLSAFEINNPSAGNLYSINSARIDFVPYQFRPALKLIKSDEPRILIADSVGVGKTIEAGLIIKELEARNNLDSVLVICPKPLITERKWELEMRRFDEDFEQLSGDDLRGIINDAYINEAWPSRHSKIIVPYSALDRRVYEGQHDDRVDLYGLKELNDIGPHFDLVIIDEAHHIRNGSMEKEKAFAYKCAKHFCDRASAVVMLTATPLQTSDDDLFTLLNLLRPDVVIDKATFDMMSQPNAFVSRCASIIRRAEDNWQARAAEELDGIIGTQWGENVIAENPLYKSVAARLDSPEITREQRIQLLSDVESLHSFNNMINRTRRKDIQDFCIRRTETIENEFTPKQRELHDALLEFERAALSALHNVRNVPFMMSTLKRQAASCVFGLAPSIRDLINRRFAQIMDDPDIEMENIGFDGNDSSMLVRLAERVLHLADNLPDADTKLEAMLDIINKKQGDENNKIIIFSTYRYTLRYIKTKLLERGYRVEQIDGSVKDEDRCLIRNRFELPKHEQKALDILLFTEVGSEGLDYQFCNMIINYDLPWNPMRIEQRIGRIDRRGQRSEYVNIINMITSGTVDAEIYNRCLRRIGIFERSIGECEEILGEIGNKIEKLVLDGKLSDEERDMKLNQIAENEIRRVQELNNLEEQQKELFGIDVSGQALSQEIQNAESRWLSPEGLQSLVVMYLNARLGKGNYVLGESGLKTLRLNVDARTMLREDLQKLTSTPASLKRPWERYLKGTVPTHQVTFEAELASENRDAFFLTAMHPLVKQAAVHFAVNAPTYISLRYNSSSMKHGEFAFSIYAWNYVGAKPHFRLVTVCENDEISDEFNEILLSCASCTSENSDYSARWRELESKHILLWEHERRENRQQAENAAAYKIESLRNNYLSQKKNLERMINENADEGFRRMKQGELENIEERFNAKQQSIHLGLKQADIHTTLIANGIIRVD